MDNYYNENKQSFYYDEYKGWIMCQIDVGNGLKEEIPVIPWISNKNIDEGIEKADEICDKVYKMIMSDDFSLIISQGDKGFTFLSEYYEIIEKDNRAINIIGPNIAFVIPSIRSALKETEEFDLLELNERIIKYGVSNYIAAELMGKIMKAGIKLVKTTGRSTVLGLILIELAQPIATMTSKEMVKAVETGGRSLTDVKYHVRLTEDVFGDYLNKYSRWESVEVKRTLDGQEYIMKAERLKEDANARRYYGEKAGDIIHSIQYYGGIDTIAKAYHSSEHKSEIKEFISKHKKAIEHSVNRIKILSEEKQRELKAEKKEEISIGIQYYTCLEGTQKDLLDHHGDNAIITKKADEKDLELVDITIEAYKTKKYSIYVEKMRDSFPKLFKEGLEKAEDELMILKGTGNTYNIRSYNYLKKWDCKDNTLGEWNYKLVDLIKFNSWLERNHRLSSELTGGNPQPKQDSFIILTLSEINMSRRNVKLLSNDNQKHALKIPEPNDDVLYGSASNDGLEGNETLNDSNNSKDDLEFFMRHGTEENYENSNVERKIKIDYSIIGKKIEKEKNEKYNFLAKMFEMFGNKGDKNFDEIATEEMYVERLDDKREIKYTYDVIEKNLTIEYGLDDKLTIKNFSNNDYSIYLPRKVHVFKGSLNSEIKDTITHKVNKGDKLKDYHKNKQYKSNGGRGIEIAGQLIGKGLEKVEELDEGYLGYKDENDCYYIFSQEENEILIRFEGEKERVILIEDFMNGDYNLAFEDDGAVLYGSKNKGDKDMKKTNPEYKFGKEIRKGRRENNNYIYNNSNGEGRIFIGDGTYEDSNLSEVKFVQDPEVVEGKEFFMGFRNKNKRTLTLLVEYDLMESKLTINYGPANMWKIIIKGFINGDYGIVLPNIAVIPGSGCKGKGRFILNDFVEIEYYDGEKIKVMKNDKKKELKGKGKIKTDKGYVTAKRK